MSRKHNAQHPDRGRSHYPQRLEARGLTKTPVMPDPEYLRRKQTAEWWLEQNPVIAANIADFSGRR